MTDPTWTKVDSYFEAKLLGEDSALEECVRASAAAGLPAIQVSPVQGRFLYLLAKLHRARRILEVGTLGGYSAICLGRALPADGRLITLEIDPKHAEVARANIDRAGLSSKVEVRLGPALESLPRLDSEGAGPFDLIFLDADRPNNRAYLEWALRLSRRGTAIVVDNVVRQGEVANDGSTDPTVRGVRGLVDALSKEKRLTATALQTVGRKGYDGFLLARVDRPSRRRTPRAPSSDPAEPSREG